MATGEFTKAEARRVGEMLSEMFDGIPKSKRFQFIGHLNDLDLFILAAVSAAPGEDPGRLVKPAAKKVRK